MDSQSSTASENSPSPREIITEDHKLQEVIQLSKRDSGDVDSQSTTASEDSPREMSIGGKRKAEEINTESVKRLRSTKAAITYPYGALRITRTPGRRHMKNCINLEEVIQGKDLISACVFSFFIGGDEL
jgi:tyrosyl-DNA phosphodiesterase-1